MMRRQASSQSPPPPPPPSKRAQELRQLALWDFNRSEETMYIGEHFAAVYGPSFADCKYITTCANNGCHVRGIPFIDFEAFTQDLLSAELNSSKPMPNYGDLIFRQVYHRWYCVHCYPAKLKNLLEFIECCGDPCGQPDEEEPPLSAEVLDDPPPLLPLRRPLKMRKLSRDHSLEIDMI